MTINNMSIISFIVLFCVSVSVCKADTLDSVFFPDEDSKGPTSHQNLPPRTTTSLNPKYGHDSGGNHFSVQPLSDGGFSASASHSSNFAGGQATGNHLPGGHNLAASQAASQSHSLNFQVGQNGFSASQSSSASQSASFNSNFGNQGSSLSASQANSQSSSFSGGGGSSSAASSQAASAGFSGGGGGGGGTASLASGAANSQSSGRPGYGYKPNRGGGGSGAASSQAASAGFSGGGGGGGGAASLASGAANSQSSGRPGFSNGYNNNILSPEFIRNLQPQPGTNRNDRRRRPTGPFYNSWFNPYWTARARSPARH